MRRCSLFCYLLFAVLHFNCSEKDQLDAPTGIDGILFTSSFDNSESEVVIQSMIRHSIMDREYHILSDRDSLILEVKGRALLGIGLKNRILDTIIVEKGENVSVNIINDSLFIKPTRSDISTHKNWLVSFRRDAEKRLKETFDDLISYPSEELIHELRTKPLIVTNDYEIKQFFISDPYMFDRSKYNANRTLYDLKFQESFDDIDSMITNSALDDGSREILQSELFLLTIDKFRRLGATVQPWLYERMITSMKNQCERSLNIDQLDFLLNHLTKKHFQKITYNDLVEAYKKIEEVPCPNTRTDLKRLCFQKLFENGNKIKESKELLDDYIAASNDTSFNTFISDKFAFEEVVYRSNGDPRLLVDINDQDIDYDEIIASHRGKVLLVDFWASWCAPCRQGMPDLKKLKSKYQGQGFEIVYASIDTYPNPWIRASKDEGIWNTNTYWLPNKKDIFNQFGIINIPRYILYDRNGNVAYRNAPKPDAIESTLVALLDR